MNNPFYSRGMGTGGWVFLVMVVGSIITVGAKLAPLYMDHNTMVKVLDGMSQEQGIVAKRTDVITDEIKKRFKLNNIRDFDFKQNMKITRPGEKVVVTLDYEARIPLIHNVDLVASFNHVAEMRD